MGTPKAGQKATVEFSSGQICIYFKLCKKKVFYPELRYIAMLPLNAIRTFSPSVRINSYVEIVLMLR